MSDKRRILRGVDERWTREAVRRRVLEAVDAGIDVEVQEIAIQQRLVVRLKHRKWRRVNRAKALVDASCELADAPVGLAVTVGWR